MNFWHMQLHPGTESRSSYSRADIKDILETYNVIGMDKEWDNDRGQPDLFRNHVKVGDIILIRKDGPLALVEVTSDWYDNKNTAVWFKMVRKIKVLSTEGAEKKQLFSEQNEEKWNDGFFNLNTLQRANHSKFIRAWYMQVHQQHIINVLKLKKQIILQGPPGTGKTYTAKGIAQCLITPEVQGSPIDISADSQVIAKGEYELVQFHPSYTYEDFVRGIVAVIVQGQVSYQVENKILVQFANKAIDNPKANYVLIIDEINRANLPSVLGELIYALEYRGEDVSTLYEYKEDDESIGERKITLPTNLYIIGTMNTADRSVGHIDYAIRRRFAFIDILPTINVISFEPAIKLFEKVQQLFNKDYLSSDFDRKDVQIGHSYFMVNNLEALEYKLMYEIKPVLYEYIKDGVLLASAREPIEQLCVTL